MSGVHKMATRALAVKRNREITRRTHIHTESNIRDSRQRSTAYEQLGRFLSEGMVFVVGGKHQMVQVDTKRHR